MSKLSPQQGQGTGGLSSPERHIVKLFPDIFPAAGTDGRLKAAFQIGKHIFSVELFDAESVYGEVVIRLTAADMGVPFAGYPAAAAFGKNAVADFVSLI